MKLEAHYVVPANHDVLGGPVQIARHTRAVKLTDHQGNHRVVDNAVVVMLVGSSGRLDEGYRIDANPRWLGKQQIVDLTSIIGSVCQLFVREGSSTLDDCLSIAVDRPRKERELLFQKPIGASYRWGIFLTSMKGSLQAIFKTRNKNFQGQPSSLTISYSLWQEVILI